MPEPAPAGGGEIVLTTLQPERWDEAARLIHGSLSGWYAAQLNQPGRFGQDWEPFRIFPELYEALDSGCAVVTLDEAGALLGICFFHPRPTHVSLGIVATSPAAAGRGVARAMVEAVLAKADAAGLPVRLVSSLMNLDSFSLYTKLGFVPGTVFQDLQFPPGKLPGAMDVRGGSIREAVAADLPGMTALERAVTGLDREQDFKFFLTNLPQRWRTLVLLDSAGKVRGFLASIQSGGTRQLGPGAMRDEADALALITAQLHAHAPGNPVVLVPARAAGLVAALYAAGARNVELHTAQVRGAGQEPQGIVIPTFLPESG
jgi:GNAT superfamily N-acetyltransferase